MSSTNTEDASDGCSDSDASLIATSEQKSFPKSSDSSASSGHSGNSKFTSDPDALEEVTRRSTSKKRGNVQTQEVRRKPKWSLASSDAEEHDTTSCPMDPPSSNAKEYGETPRPQRHRATESSDSQDQKDNQHKELSAQAKNATWKR